MNSELLADWPKIAVLLDQALALDGKARAQWLDSLAGEQAAWRAPLARLLQAEAAAQAADFLGSPAACSALLDSTADADAQGDAEGDAARPDAQFQAGQLVGPWRLLSELGQGGMASVWLAQAAAGDFERQVALKLPHSRSPQFLERFKRERDILARLNHPGIARLFDAGVTAQGLPWLALERVQGVDLLSWCATQACAVPARLGLVLQICAALQFAHARLVVHRDIKPSNVLVQADGQLRLLDFGIARLLDVDEAEQPQLTQLGARPMTPDYASPEQVLGEEPGVASDVYSLGVLLYQLLSGHSPYLLERPCSRHRLERAVLEQSPLPPSARLAGTDKARSKALRGDLDTIVLKALAKLPQQRYSSVEALADDLRRHLAGVPVLARRQSWGYVARRFVRRHRLGVAATAVAVAGLLGTTGWALASSKQARSEARRAEAMYQFTVGLFNPDQDQFANIKQPDMPLKTVVERGARRVLTQLQDQPEARVRLLQDLVPLSEQLGLIDLAASLAQARIDETKRLYGDQSLDYADALRSQLLVLDSTAQYQQGLEVARKALQIYEAKGIQDADRLAPVHEKLGGFGMRLHAPDPQDAAHLARAAALLATQPNVNTLALTYLQLGLLRAYLGDLPAAYEAGHQGLATNRRQFGTESWQAAQTESFLGTWADMIQRPAEAEALLRHSVAATRQIQGPDAIGLARSEIALATVLFGGTGRDEARRLMADALRIADLPLNANFNGLRDQVQVGALGLAVRGGDGAAMRQGCLPYAALSVKSTTPYFAMLVTQACTASALHDGDLARAARALDATGPIKTYFAKAPSWTLSLDLRQGELALARGDKAEALRLWRHSLAVSNTTQLPWQSQAWALIARNTRMDDAELARMKAFKQHLAQVGGERYYAEFLDRLREAEKAQALRPA